MLSRHIRTRCTTVGSAFKAARYALRGVSQVLTEPMAWNQPIAVVTTLPNGIRVVSKQTFSDVSTIGVFVDAGVRDETPATCGAARLIEKLALTGTAKRPKAKLEQEVESMGAELVVSAGREQTSFMLNLPGGDVSKGVDLLGDIVSRPAVANLSKEKAAILRSLDDTDQANRLVLDDRLHACAFRDVSLGFSCIGPFEGVENLTEDALKSYLASTYTADSIVLAAVGPGKHEDLVKAATSAFGGFKASDPKQGVSKPYFCGAELLYRNDEMGRLAYIPAGFEGVPARSPDAVTFMVMQYVIGSYKKGEGLVPGTISGNRVVNAVANKMDVGCAEEFEMFNHFYKDTSMFGFYAVCDEVAVEHCIGELMFGIGNLSHGVTEEEVARAKRELKAALYGKSGSMSMCVDLGKEMLSYGRSVPAAEMMLRIDAIDAEEVKRVAWKYLADAEIAVTALGPLHGMPQYLDLRKSTNMHRY